MQFGCGAGEGESLSGEHLFIGKAPAFQLYGSSNPEAIPCRPGRLKTAILAGSYGFGLMAIFTDTLAR